MTEEQASQIITEAGFTQFDIFMPSPETKGRYVIRVYTAKGWKYLRIAGEAANPDAQLTAWLSTLQ